MHRPLPCLLLIATALNLSAQTQNALDFDGADDRVIVPNASALIAGSTGVTMSCWFYPRNAAPGFPDFDGIAGFRNENDCDFYLLQLTASTVEARIRFGPLDFYTVEGGPVQLNDWNHIALVHDGSTLSLFVNGQLSGSVAAPGTLANTTSTFQIGNLTYDINEFTLNGRADEIGLWKRALSVQEIQCLVNGSADLTDTDLVLYYGCDQGTPGGDNTAITALTDATGNIDGQLTGFALTGAGSNFVVGAGVGVSLNGNVCPGGTYLYDGDPLTAGSYTFTYTSVSGCDSIVTVTVNEIPLNTNVSATATTLTCLNGSAQWQWLDCANAFAAIPGATFQTFTPTTNGSYAVEVTDNGCTDTSACYDITSIGLEEHATGPSMLIMPTITQDRLRLLIDDPRGQLDMRITDMEGRTAMHSNSLATAEHWIDVAALSSGPYLVHVGTDLGTVILRFVRE